MITSGFGHTPIIDEDPEEWEPRDRRVHFDRSSFGNYSNNDNSADDHTSQDNVSINRDNTPRNRQAGKGFNNALREHDWTRDHADISMATRGSAANLLDDNVPVQKTALTWEDFTLESENQKGETAKEMF